MKKKKTRDKDFIFSKSEFHALRLKIVTNMGELKKYYSQHLFQGKHLSFRMSNKQKKNQNSNDVRFGD